MSTGRRSGRNHLLECARDIFATLQEISPLWGRFRPMTRSRHLSVTIPYPVVTSCILTADRDAVDGEGPDPTVARLELTTYWELAWNWWPFLT